MSYILHPRYSDKRTLAYKQVAKTHTMTDVIAPTDVLADQVSKASYDEEKARAAKTADENAQLKARLETFESRDRSKLQSFQPAMEEYLKELSTDFATAENKAHFDAMGDWARSCHERGNLDSQMQLGTIISCSASQLKRVREDASVQSATASQLAQSAEREEKMAAENATLRQRTDELSTSLKEIQANSETLQLKLEKAGMLKEAEKFDFSKAASREVEPKEEVTRSKENASRVTTAPIATIDPSMALMAFVSGATGSSRFMPAATNHAVLGAAAAEQVSMSISSALRPM